MRQTRPSSGGTETIRLYDGEQAVHQNVAYSVVTLTSDEVSKIAAEVKVLPKNFDPASWLEENFDSIATLAMAAARDIVVEALEIGLADHPLVLLGQRTSVSKTFH
jgi:hypothetical protein